MPSQDPFTLLGAPKKYDLDLPVLEKTYRDLARALHPDRFTGAPPTEKRAALSKAIEVNEAWRALQDPVARAECLFLTLGVATGDGHESKPSPAFLMDMMEQREALAEARDLQDYEKVRGLARDAELSLQHCQEALVSAFAKFDETQNREKLAESTRLLGEIRFHKRFLGETEAVLFDASDPPHDAV